MVRYRYGHPNGFAEFLSFLSSVPKAEFAKVTRSTVPLLAWWADSRRVEKLRKLLHFGDRLEECFEYPVAASCPKCTVKGKGKSSFTDVMMQTVAETVAIEAKYTEKLYPTIKRWAGSPVEGNKQLVLDHWMKCCIGTSQKWGRLQRSCVPDGSSNCFRLCPSGGKKDSPSRRSSPLRPARFGVKTCRHLRERRRPTLEGARPAGADWLPRCEGRDQGR
jgi:hypothetical protein